jgi:hypothetical protein
MGQCVKSLIELNSPSIQFGNGAPRSVLPGPLRAGDPAFAGFTVARIL